MDGNKLTFGSQESAAFYRVLTEISKSSQRISIALERIANLVDKGKRLSKSDA